MLSLLAPLAAARPLAPADFDRLREVSHPALSPDGALVAYEVAATRVEDDEVSTDLYLARTDGSGARRLTSRDDDEGSPRFSPDGRWIAFLSSRDDERHSAQLWVLPTDGGEARRVTDWAGGIGAFDWAPDSQRLVVTVYDPDPEAIAASKDPDRPPAPLVIDRLWFKEDGTGYLRHFRQHLALVDLATGALAPLTSGDTDEFLPSFSPDGTRVAYVAKRGPEPDRTFDYDVWVIEARAGAAPVDVTADNAGPDCDPEWSSAPAWSPDGRALAIVRGSDPELLYYDSVRVAVVPAAGGPATDLLPGLDRNTWRPRYSADGKRVYYLLEDDGTQRLGVVGADGRGRAAVVSPADLVVSDFVVGGGRKERVVVVAEGPTRPAELAGIERDGPRWLTTENAAWLADADLADARPLTATSADGTEIHGLLYTPPGPGPFPTYLRLHGGPVAQYDRSFFLEVQVWVGAGYAVILPNPRGSSGRGEAFCTAIFADWGRLDTEDVLATVDRAVADGVADPARLVVGGWSYGGILTDHVIARDGRFAAAISGAGLGDAFAGFGADMYVREYLAELGAPWAAPDVWARNSFPFLHADRIHTPTLFLVGTEDFNVPVIGSEQMYQALRVLGVPSELVLYPGEAHAIERPSFQRDRMERRLAWAARFAGPRPTE